MIKCDCCEKTLKVGDEYILFEEEHFCSDCYTENHITDYFLGGEFLGTDDDGVQEVIHGYEREW